jgi:phosphoglycerate dehydrogenase-like enzyme
MLAIPVADGEQRGPMTERGALNSVSKPKVAVQPPIPAMEDAVRAGGGEVVAPNEADAVVWTVPFNPDGLKEILKDSPARWVQLPFAGIEEFFTTGVIDDSRVWTCAKGTYGPATADGAMALIYAAARNLQRHARAKTWLPRAETAGHRRIMGSTALLIGTGGIGAALAEWLTALGAHVLAANRSGAPAKNAEETVKISDAGPLIARADWIVLAAPSTPETYRMVNAEFLAKMKRDGWIVNVARGDLVDTGALVDALRDKRIGGAALDVVDPEPLPDDHPLWSMDNVIITSHTANTAELAIPELAELITRNVRAFAAGAPLEGLVDTKLGY